MEFMEPVPYYAVNDNDPSAIRSRAAKLEAELRGLESRNAPWVERQRVQAELDSVSRQLASAEMDRQVDRRREQGATNAKPGKAQTPTRWQQLVACAHLMIVASKNPSAVVVEVQQPNEVVQNASDDATEYAAPVPY